MIIFSDWSRSESGSRSRGESSFEFYDRIAGSYWDQVRALVNDWFAHLPPGAQADVRGRLESDDSRQFTGAFLELYIHEALLVTGHDVTCHPDVSGSGRHPDFLAVKDGVRTYVEARSASASDASVSQTARVDVVYDSLDRLESPNFFLWIDVEAQGPASLAARRLRSKVQRWLNSLDPDREQLTADKHLHDLPSLDHEDAGWRIVLRAIGKPPAARGRAGVRPLGVFGGARAFYTGGAQSLAGALADKGSAYGQLDAAYVVAVACPGLGLGDDDVLDALYGTEAIQLGTDADGTELTRSVRQSNGYWYRGDRWDHRGVSAVLVVKDVAPYSAGQQTHTLWQHPDPHQPAEGFGIWRRATQSVNGDIDFVDPARSQNDWFNLGHPWPVGEPWPRRQ